MKKVMFIASTGGHLDELLQLAPCFNNYNYIDTYLNILNQRTNFILLFDYVAF